MASPDNIAPKTALLSVAGNILLAVIKLVSGILGNSFALIADAIESLSDTIVSFLAYFGLRYSLKPADENHPYGHGKAEPLVTFVVVVFMIIAAIAIIWQSIEHILQPHPMPKPFTLVVLGVIILFKEFAYRFVQKRGKEVNSTVLAADAWHHRSDAITSLAAFIGISIALILGNGFQAADDWAALVAAGIILYNAYLIFRPALSEVMDEHVYDQEVEQVRMAAMEVDGVIDTEKCFIRKHGMSYIVDLHVIVNGDISVREGHDISHALKDHLMSRYPPIHDVLIHIEPAVASHQRK